MRKVFNEAGDFEATRAAEKWCDENGLSVGRMQAGAPRGLLYGDFDISKWSNMNAQEIAELHGKMTGDWSNGPVVVEVDDD
jgi:hypothetical protein